MPRGQYRQSPLDAEPMAFVSMPVGGCFITESVYRARGYAPRFEALPLQEEYEAAAAEKQDIEADEDADVAEAQAEHAIEAFETLALAMARYGRDSDAWRDFAADCDKCGVAERDGSRVVMIAPDRWAYWSSVAAGADKDYDEEGGRAAGRPD
jgi:hypothetical protein